MKKEYTVEENGVIWYEEDGIRYSFFADENNPYYSAYLNRDIEEVTPAFPVIFEEPTTEPPTEQTQEGEE